ncbi:unnamed protein product, partial [Brassica oleracea var. botrytis]
GCNEPQAEEGEEKDATESTTPQLPVRYCVNPAHVKALDEEAKRKNKENMWVDQITTMQHYKKTYFLRGRSELSLMSAVGIILTGGENDLLNATPEENDVSLIHYIFM